MGVEATTEEAPEAGRPCACVHLDAPVDAVWEVLTSRAGARRWLHDPDHGGLRVGAPFPLWDSLPGVITEVRDRSIRVALPAGRTATIAFRPTPRGCELAVFDDGATGAPDLTEGWRRLANAAAFVINQTKQNRRSRQAVVVVHGIGSQRPLSTAKGFTDALAQGSARFSKPDLLSKSYELRRFQLPRTRRRPRTDVFELYWADKVPGTTLGHTTAWLRSLLSRRPKDVSERLRPVAYLVWAVAVLLAVAGVAGVTAIGIDGFSRLWTDATVVLQIAWVSAALSILGGAATGFLVHSLGDAARYLEAKPDNIAVRQAIRSGGVSLLRRLHEEGSYDRIVVVGHSLGSVIAYDILQRYWHEVYRQHGTPLAVDQAELAELERTVAAARDDPAAVDPDGYRQAQRAVWSENRRLGFRWLVTDLVTVGSPLAHAGTLLARSPGHVTQLQQELELPTCPPHLDGDGITRRDRYLVDGEQRSIRVLTHASLFGVTRWTNLYVPAPALVLGDAIGGPLAPVFGPGVKDVAVTTAPWWRRRTPLAHSSYWRLPTKPGAASPVADLVEAVDLDSGPWLDVLVRDLPWSWFVEPSDPAHATPE